MSLEHINSLISTTVSNWTVLRHLGSGANADVFLAQDIENQELVALKILKHGHLTCLRNEALILQSIQHENIITFKDFKTSVTVNLPNSKTTSISVLATETALRGDFLEYINKQEHKCLSEDTSRVYFTQLINCLSCLHKKDIAHRDIKLDNLMLDDDLNLKLVDFGFAEMILPGQKSLKVAGTPAYFSPEMHANMPHSAQSSDLFAAGIILFAMVCGYMPFNQADTNDKAYRLFLRQEDKFWNCHEKNMRKKIPEWKFSASLKELLARIWSADTERRFTLEGIESHEWMLQNCPNKQL